MTKFAVQKFNREEHRRSSGVGGKAIRLGTFHMSVLLIGLILFAGLSYLYYINQTATGGFDIKGIENRIEQLNQENERLEIKTAELQSLSVIETTSAELNMVATTHIDYVSTAESAVAVR